MWTWAAAIVCFIVVTSRSLRSFIIAKFSISKDLAISSHYREGEIPYNSRINTVKVIECTAKENKKALRPGIAHLSKQAKGQTHHLNIPDCLNLLNYDRMILTYIAKNKVYVLIYLTTFIHFCTQIF